MVERFERDLSIPANGNVRERIFSVSDDRILLKYHLEDQRVTASTREFIKPPNYSSEKGIPLQLTSDATTAFQVCNDFLELEQQFTSFSELLKNCFSFLRLRQ